MRPYEVDVPVRVMLWTRPECLKRQFEVLKKAAPSTLFLISDGGRNEREMALIRESRAVFENIDWDCTVHKLFFEENQGMYTMMKHTRELIWSNVDRCIFLEDDYVPAVSFFRFCAEMLEKYKDDPRIEMITGHNVLGTYPDAEPYDYFFTQNGWSIWGTACWRRTAEGREYPFDYADNEYIKRCIKDNTNDFWYKKVDGYCKGQLVDNHIPGSEYYHAINSILNHSVCIVPTKNMIKNIGTVGEHTNLNQRIKGDGECLFNMETYEIEFPIKHPKYVIDDKHYGNLYAKMLGQIKKPIFVRIYKKFKHGFIYLIHGELFDAIKRKFRKREIEK